MRRLFWIGVGVTVTIVAVRKYRELKAHYSPPAVVERAAQGLGEKADDLRTRIGAGVHGFGGDLRAGMERREAQLREAILSEGQTRPEATRARRAAAAGSHAAGSQDARPRAWQERDAEDPSDDDDLPYSF